MRAAPRRTLHTQPRTQTRRRVSALLRRNSIRSRRYSTRLALRAAVARGAAARAALQRGGARVGDFAARVAGRRIVRHHGRIRRLLQQQVACEAGVQRFSAACALQLVQNAVCACRRARLHRTRASSQGSVRGRRAAQQARAWQRRVSSSCCAAWQHLSCASRMHAAHLLYAQAALLQPRLQRVVAHAEQRRVGEKGVTASAVTRYKTATRSPGHSTFVSPFTSAGAAASVLLLAGGMPRARAGGAGASGADAVDDGGATLAAMASLSVAAAADSGESTPARAAPSGRAARTPSTPTAAPDTPQTPGTRTPLPPSPGPLELRSPAEGAKVYGALKVLFQSVRACAEGKVLQPVRSASAPAA